MEDVDMPTIHAASTRSAEETQQLADGLMKYYLDTLNAEDRLSMKLGFIGGIKIKAIYFGAGQNFKMIGGAK